MSFGLKKGAKKPDEQGGKIQGPGTGTSDDVKKTVPEGTYIMPADSTAAIGEGNLDQMGKAAPVDVNVSNGEYQMPPEQVQAIGAQVLDQMKDQTHTPTGLPHLQQQPGQKPELFFADGGLVRKEDEWKNNLKTGSQPQGSMGIGQARTGFNPNQAASTPALTDQKNIQFPTAQPKANAPAQPQRQPAQQEQSQSGGFGIKNTAKMFLAPEHDNGAWNPIGGAVNTATGIGKGVIGGLGALAAGAGEGVRSTAAFLSGSENPNRGNMVAPSAEFSGQGFDQARLGMRQMFGLSPSTGTPGIGSVAQPPKTMDNPFQKGTATPQPTQKQSVANRQQATAAAQQPSFDDQVNAALYGGTSSGGQPQQAADPYAIQRKGNSFSYANPAAAAQARAAGMPELQSSGGFGLGKANDPRGVRNLMANTREIGLGATPVQDAIQQFQNIQGQGLGLKYPERPVMSDEEKGNRADLARQINSAIDRRRGPTAKQAEMLLRLSSDDPNALDIYKTDANNATSVQNNSANNAASILQTGMREDGQNQRQAQSLDQDSQKFNANFGLQARQQAQNEKKEGFGIRQAERMEKLHEMYDKAQTDDQRKSIMQRINRLTGKDSQALQGKDRYMTVGGGQEWDEKAMTMVNRPQQIFDTQTQQFVDLSNTTGAGNVPKPGEVVNGYRYKGGDPRQQSSWEAV